MNIGHVHIAINAIDFCALFACIGLLIARVGLLPATAFDHSGMMRAWHRQLGAALALLTATGLALLPVRVMDMGGGSAAETLSILPSVLRQTHFGHIWLLHLLGLFILWIGRIASLRVRNRAASAFMLIAIVATAFTYSASSHAADSGDFTLTEFNDWLHILSASLWGGSILASALFIFPVLARLPGEYRVLMGEATGRLSGFSAVALAIVLLTGIGNAATRLHGFDELARSTYGHVLVVKLILVFVMAGIGAANRFILLPKVRRWAAQSGSTDDRPVRRMVTAIRIDVVLVLLILCAAAVLIQSMPPAAMKNMPSDGVAGVRTTPSSCEGEDQDGSGTTQQVSCRASR
jgi:putative copper resistance protein D